MVNLGISDLIFLVCVGWITGYYIIAQNTKPWWLMKLVGGMSNASWISLTAFANLLAFNRFVLVNHILSM